MADTTRELLEANHPFPGRFVFKAVGRAEGDFVSSVVAAVRETLNQDFDAPYETRQTPAGRHVAVTVTPWVDSADDVLLVFARIQQLPDLIMLL